MRTLILTLLFTATVFGSGDSEEFEIYSEANQLGFVARRTFKNERQQPYKINYYHSEDGQNPSMIRLLTYQDEKEIWMGEYSGEFQLLRSLETIYSADGNKSKMRWRDPDGIVRYEILLEDGKSVSHLYYDQSGSKIVTIRGEIPEGVDVSKINVTK